MKIRTINIAVLSLKKHETADQLDFDDYDDDEFNCKTQIYIYILIVLSTNYGRFQWTTILLFWV